MKNIVIPTDFSENAFKAACYGLKLFANEKCAFHLLHTFTPKSYHPGYFSTDGTTSQLENIERKKAEQGLEAFEKRLSTLFTNPNHTFEKYTANNTLAREIAYIGQRYPIDLVVMGTQGATSAKAVFLGSNTMDVILKAVCPVLAVPEKTAYRTPKNVLFATDYRFDPNNRCIPLVEEICTAHDSKVTILNVHTGKPWNQKQQEVKEFLDLCFENTAHVFQKVVNSNLLNVIETFQYENTTDLLIMLHKKNSFVHELLFEPVVVKTVLHTTVPFLVIPSEKRMRDAFSKREKSLY